LPAREAFRKRVRRTDHLICTAPNRRILAVAERHWCSPSVAQFAGRRLDGAGQGAWSFDVPVRQLKIDCDEALDNPGQ
jgi:hypothetical protein